MKSLYLLADRKIQTFQKHWKIKAIRIYSTVLLQYVDIQILKYQSSALSQAQERGISSNKSEYRLMGKLWHEERLLFRLCCGLSRPFTIPGEQYSQKGTALSSMLYLRTNGRSQRRCINLVLLSALLQVFQSSLQLETLETLLAHEASKRLVVNGVLRGISA